MNSISSRLRFFLILLAVALVSSFIGSPGQAKSLRESLSGDLNLRAYYNDLSGNKDNSFLTEGPGFLSDVYFYYDNTSPDTSQIQWNGLLYLQGTDDPRFEIRNDKVRVRNVYLTAHRQNHWKATGGYFTESFSSLTFNSSLLGLNTQYHLTDTMRFKLFGGRANRARPGNSLRRYAEGSRLEWSPVADNTLSLSYVRTHDDEGSLDSDELSGIGSDTATNVVKAIEYDGQITDEIQVRGEFALSDFDTEPASGASSVENQDATQLYLRWRPVQQTEVRTYYEKVDPDFHTLSGFARTDRELSRLNWNQKITSSISVLSEYEVWENGLEGTTTDDVTSWSLETNYTPRSTGWWRRRLVVYYESRENEGETEGIDFDGTDSNDEDQYLWGADLSNQFGQTGFDLGYSREHFGSDSETINLLDVSLNHRFEFQIPLTYTASGTYKETEDKLGSGQNPNVDRSVRFNNEVILAEGRAQELRFYHRYSNEDASNSAELVDHTVGTEFRHVLDRKLDSRLSFSYELYDHTDKGDPTQDYQEQTVELQYQTPF